MNTTAYLFFLTISLFSTTLKSLFIIGFTFVSKLWYNNIFYEHYSPTLSDDIIFFCILNRLPPKSLLRFSCVSKLWYNTIHHDTLFIASHFNHSKSKPSLVFISTTLSETHFKYLDDQENQGASYPLVGIVDFRKNWRNVIGNVNGLTCFGTIYVIEICNTSTHEILGIPYPPPENPYDSCWYGFGFDPLMNQYKVLRITMLATEFICQIFTLGPSAQDCIWRDITITCRTCFHLLDLLDWDDNVKRPLVFSNGALFKVIPSTNTIIMFDIHYETFQMIPGLQISRGDDRLSRLYTTICEFRGCSYAVYRTILEDGDEFSFYALKKEQCGSNSNVGNSIHFVFEQTVCVPTIETICVLSFTEFSGQILVHWYDLNNMQCYYVYNSHTHILQKEEVSIDSYGYSALFVKHIDNLLSLKKLVPMSASPGAPATTDEGSSTTTLSLSRFKSVLMSPPGARATTDDEGSSTTLSLSRFKSVLMSPPGARATTDDEGSSTTLSLSRFKSR